MGIPGLWDILGDGEVKSIAQISTEHFTSTGRPLRVAIDEAGWRFHNLNDFQVAKIREKVPQANPIEKAILWRLLRLMRMNIQPIFVFDGPSRPWKRGGTAGRIDWKKIDLLRKLLDVLKIPHHRAPAEAEAECARLNELGIVDAVWTDDGDALMFGARVLIKEYRESGNHGMKSDTLIRIYRAAEIERQHSLNRQGLILFALLSGGDYNTKGLEGCGPKAALEAARYAGGRLGQILCETPLRQLHCFTESLREYFQQPGSRSVYVPPGFPRDLHVKNYREPKVSTLEQAHDLRGLRKGWDVPIDETKLRPFLLERFDFWTKVYMKHVIPVLLTKTLVKTPLDGVSENLVFDIELVSKRGQDHNQAYLERKIIFSPLVCTGLNLRVEPSNESWSQHATKDGVMFDPTEPVEAEMLEYVLEAGLGATEMQRLRDEASKPKPRQRKIADTLTTGEDSGVDNSQTGATSTATHKEPAKKRKSTTNKDTSAATQKRQNSKKNDIATEPVQPDAQPPPARKGFRLPSALERFDSISGLSDSTISSSQDFRTPSRSFDASAQSQSDYATPSAAASQSMRRADDTMRQPCPQSSQIHPDAASWSFSPPSHVELEDHGYGQLLPPYVMPDRNVPSSSVSRKPSNLAAAMPTIPQIHPPSHDELTSTSRAGRGTIILDLTSDDEDSTPVLPRPPPPVIRPVPAPTLKMPDTRKDVAAARLRHFEMNCNVDHNGSGSNAATQAVVMPTASRIDRVGTETIDLTLDD